jgi:hypothetical protein
MRERREERGEERDDTFAFESITLGLESRERKGEERGSE